MKKPLSVSGLGSATTTVLLLALWALIFVISVTGTWGCATKADKEVNAELKQEAPVSSDLALRRKADVALAKANFTEEQKVKIRDLQKQARAELGDLREESLKLRALMMKALLNPQYDSAEVSAIEKKYKNVEEKRVALVLQSVDKMNDILGRDYSPSKEQLYQEFMNHDIRN